MESEPQRHCPHCGMPVAQKAETCLMCGAALKEPRKSRIGLPSADLLLPLIVVGALALLWIWKPWQSGEGGDATEVVVETSPTPSRTPSAMPTATYAVAPSATPLYSPTPPPTATLPPDTTRHTVKSGETVSTIAKLYGTTTGAILKANGLKTNTIISIDQELLIPLPAANTSTPTPTLTPSPTPFVYTIKSGDTLSAIAKKYKTTVEALMEANNIGDATNIQVGTRLTIVQPPDFTLTMAYETYEVEQGDTLYTISGEYGLTIAEIKEINNLTGNNLSVGQQLRIPVGTATPIPTNTPTPTLTPTPGPARPAPALLAPPQNTAFEGADRVIILNWASVGILGEDEWYTVRVRRSGAVAQVLPVEWTKVTSWRLPAELYIEGLTEPQRFNWQVYIMRQTGVDEDGDWLGEQISPAGEVRTFTWK
jgi:LysM repeat protein/predicted nucleic acid-binding Zn ribbon protein